MKTAKPVNGYFKRLIIDREFGWSPSLQETTPESPLDLEGEDRLEVKTALKLYFREIGQVKLLTPQEEVTLAGYIKKGDAEAREQMIKANLRLVVKIAKDYEHMGMPLLDLINEGNIGLMKAVERFDPTKGAKLSTYASWWIRHYIRRALANQGKIVRLPVHVADKVYKLDRTEMRLQGLLGRKATNQELAEELGLTTNWVNKLRSLTYPLIPLDAPIGNDDASRWSNLVADEHAKDPRTALEEKSDVERMLELLGKLPKREAKVLRLRFGLNGGDEKTLKQVGEKFGLTRERIRQLEGKALFKIRELMDRDNGKPARAIKFPGRFSRAQLRR